MKKKAIATIILLLMLHAQAFAQGPFPVYAHADNDLSGHGAWMESWASLFRNADGTGKLHLHLWSHANHWDGHHGVSTVFLLDGNQNLIWNSPPQALGIAGKADPTGKHNRSADYDFAVPKDYMDKTSFIGIVQQNTGESALGEWLVSEVAKPILKNVATALVNATNVIPVNETP